MNSDKSQEEVKAMNDPLDASLNIKSYKDELQQKLTDQEMKRMFGAYEENKKLKSREQALVSALKLCREALEKHHKHDQQNVVVFFEQDGNPIDIATDLGEAYSESALCDETGEALKSISALLSTEAQGDK